MPDTTTRSEPEDIPQLPPPALGGHRLVDGHDTYRDPDFDAASSWSYPFAAQNGYIHVARFVNEFRVERAEGRDFRFTERVVRHEDRLVTPIGGGRCRTEVRVTYEERMQRGWLLLMKYEHWTTDTTLEWWLENASGKGLTALSTGLDTVTAGASLTAGSATGTAATGTAATVGAPLALGTATALSAFVGTSSFMAWLKEDDVHELYETGWKVLGWYLTSPEPVPGAEADEQWELVGEHPCERTVTGSPRPPANAVWGDGLELLEPLDVPPPPAAPAPPEPPPPPGPPPADQSGIEFDPTRPEDVPFDLPPLDPSSFDDHGGGAYSDPTHDEGTAWIRPLARDGDSWIIVVFDNIFRAVRDELYDDEDVVFQRTGHPVDHAIGDGLCELRELVTRHTLRSDGYRMDMSYRVLRVSTTELEQATGVGADGFLGAGSALTAWADVAAKVAADTRFSTTAPAGVVNKLGIGSITPVVGIGLNLVSLFSTETEEVELLATGWAPVGFIRHAAAVVPGSYHEDWVTVGPPHPCDPRLRLGYVPDWAPAGLELPSVEVPELAAPPVDPLPEPGSLVIEPEIELPADPIERPVGSPIEVVAAPDRTGSGRGLYRDEITHVVTEEEPPDDVRYAHFAAERHISLVTGVDIIGRTLLLSWTDEIGPGREARGIRFAIPVNAAGRPVAADAFPIHERVGWIDVAYFPEEPWDPGPDGSVERVFNLWVDARDSKNGRVIHATRAVREETPYTALRHAFEGFWATPWFERFWVNRHRPLADVVQDGEAGGQADGASETGDGPVVDAFADDYQTIRSAELDALPDEPPEEDWGELDPEPDTDEPDTDEPDTEDPGPSAVPTFGPELFGLESFPAESSLWVTIGGDGAEPVLALELRRNRLDTNGDPLVDRVELPDTFVRIGADGPQVDDAGLAEWVGVERDVVRDLTLGPADDGWRVGTGRDVWIGDPGPPMRSPSGELRPPAEVFEIREDLLAGLQVRVNVGDATIQLVHPSSDVPVRSIGLPPALNTPSFSPDTDAIAEWLGVDGQDADWQGDALVLGVIPEPADEPAPPPSGRSLPTGRILVGTAVLAVLGLFVYLVVSQMGGDDTSVEAGATSATDTAPDTAPGDTAPDTAPGDTAPDTAPGDTAPDTAPGDTAPDTAPGDTAPGAAVDAASTPTPEAPATPTPAPTPTVADQAPADGVGADEFGAELAASPVGQATAAGVGALAGGAPDFDCLVAAVHPSVEGLDDLGFLASPDVSTWPPVVAQAYAEGLEQCHPLRPFYLAQFGQYSYTRANCPEDMTDRVLAAYSWRRFLDDGILDPALAPGLQAEFDLFVQGGYEVAGCYLAE